MKQGGGLMKDKGEFLNRRVRRETAFKLLHSVSAPKSEQLAPPSKTLPSDSELLPATSATSANINSATFNYYSA